jgi:ATP-dependent protease HslVU (ClpYQ) peptidase subunit
MSIIVVKKYNDKIVLGCDSQTTQWWNKNIREEPIKLVDLGDIIVGSAGMVKTTRLLHTFINQRKITKLHDEVDILNFIRDFEKWIKDNTSSGDVTMTENEFIFVKEDRVWIVREGYLIQEVENFAAIGSGYDKALIALELGHDVEETVKAVCKFDVFCSEPVKIIEKKIQRKSEKSKK